MRFKGDWIMPRLLGLRPRLAGLILIGILPSLVAISYLLRVTYQERQEQVSMRLLETTRTLSMSMDKELDGISSSLQAMATSPAIDSGDYARFHAQIRMILPLFPGTDIILADRTGQQIVNSYMPFGSSLPKRNVPDRLQQLFKTGRPSISGLYTGAISGRRFVSVDVPVTRNGSVILELGAALPVDQLLQSLELPKLPPEWTATILDSNNVVVARSQDQGKLVGKQAEMPVLAERRKVAPEGTLEAIGLAGVPVFVGYSKSPMSGWTIVLSVPKTTVMHDLKRWLYWTLAGVVALGLLGISMALLVGDQVARSIRALIAPAMALGRGESVDIGHQSMAETQDLADSLTKASQILLQREKELRESKKSFRQAFEQAAVGFFHGSLDGSFLRVNQRFCDIVGYTQEELARLTFRDITHPEDLEMDNSQFARLISEAVYPVTVELRYRHKEGHAVCVSRAATLVYDDSGKIQYIMGVVEDITERKRNTELLAKGHQRLAQIIEGTNVGTWEWNVQTGETVFNERWAQIIGYSLDELTPISIGMWAALAHPEDLKRSNELLERHFLGELSYYDFECRMKHKDGSWVWVHDRGKVAIKSDDGKPLIMSGTHLDITERKRSQELRDSVERTIRHDLRAPASSAIYLAALLRTSANLTEEQKRLLGFFEYSGKSMLDTLNSTLDLFKIESKQYTLEPEPFDALNLVYGLRDVLRLGDKHTDIGLSIELNACPPDAGASCICLGQATLARMALQNLLMNAVEASPQGESVSVSLHAGKDCLIEIRNKGAVPEEIRDSFFDKYVTSGKAGGSGIGTYSAMMMIKAQGGEIAMHTSDVDAETVVSVRLPCAQP